MKILLSFTLIVLTFTACQAQKKVPDWKEFVSEKDNFKVLLPTKPVESVKEVEEGGLKTQTYRFSVSLPLKAFMVTYADYPNVPTMNKEQLKSNYDNFVSNMLSQTNSKLVSEREVWLDEKFGREFKFAGSDNINITCRIFLIDKRFYQLITSVESPLNNDKETDKEVRRFLDSFQILKK